MCDWLDDSTVFALLSPSTAASGGMIITLRPDVLWPQGYQGSCDDSSDSKCAPVQSLQVNELFPCDVAATPVRELCIQPVASIQAPSVISSYPGTTLTLDASRSTGGGVRPLIYTWHAYPRATDNYYAVSNALAVAGSVPTVTLGFEQLDGGSKFTFTLVVSTFLGSASVPLSATITRATAPVPTIIILAPPLLAVPASSTVALQAQGTSGGSVDAPSVLNLTWSPIDFQWSHVASAGNSTVALSVMSDAESRVMIAMTRQIVNSDNRSRS